ncbi:MAG: hypothetical protein DMF67_00975 [Acidobacteria bacterium]|nr:MAG: hypothetical protein DMF66_06100 [Acidobacteriota bacterium]PYS85553.1 MAG: hypothetical protein DMF67_00975 [Acidobacteriota bacterium]
MRRINSRQLRAVFVTTAFIFLSTAAARVVSAQSNDPSYPAPVFTNEIGGRIAPRDVGDPRRTRRFYTFRGTEGDLTITLDSSELSGDVDVFTASGLRPLLKFTLLGDAAHLSKSFYVRSEETLVLRVEARAVGDVEGTYRIQFGGSFEPAPADLANAPQPVEPTVSNTESRGKNVRRVTSTGARIEEPKPVPTPAEEAKTTEAKPAPAASTAGRKAPAPPRRAGGTRASAGRARAGTARPRPTATAPATATSETKSATEAGQPAEAKAETKTESETPSATPAKTTPASRRRGARAPRRAARGESAGTSDSGSAAPPAPGPPPAPTQRLVIVTKDGETIERDMSTVRRVTVEGNQVVVITKDGKIIRQPLTNVLRMSIEP